MAVNLCAAHKKTDSHAAQEVLLACFLQSCSTRNRARVLYTKDNSCVTCEFGLSNSTKIQEHTLVAAHECQLSNELYCMYVTMILEMLKDYPISVGQNLLITGVYI